MQFLDTKRVLNPNGDCGFLAFLGDLAWLLDYKAIYYCISLGNAVFVAKFNQSKSASQEKVLQLTPQKLSAPLKKIFHHT